MRIPRQLYDALRQVEENIKQRLAPTREVFIDDLRQLLELGLVAEVEPQGNSYRLKITPAGYEAISDRPYYQNKTD